MKNKLIALVLILAMGLLLCSCQLAVAGGDELPEEDRLIGVYVTGEYLDLWDFEGYFEDNASKIIGGGEISAADSQKYGARVYGAPVLSESGEISCYEFEGIEGAGLYSFKYTDVNGQEQERMYHSPDYMTDAKYNDSGAAPDREITLESTVYLSVNTGSGGYFAQYYANPVYQTPEGDVYLTSGQGNSFGGDTLTGGSSSMSLSNSTTKTQDSVTVSESFKVTVSAYMLPEIESVAILAMDASDEVVSSSEYELSQLGGGISTGGEYLVIEYLTASEDKPERYVVSRGDESFPVYTSGGNGLCNIANIALIWR